MANGQYFLALLEKAVTFVVPEFAQAVWNPPKAVSDSSVRAWFVRLIEVQIG